MRVLFGDCLLDSETRELTRAGHGAHVSPRAFQLLELLLAERPKALAKEVLQGCSYRLLCEISLGQGENILGRDPESVAWIDDESVSRRHARIRIDGEKTLLEDSRTATRSGSVMCR